MNKAQARRSSKNKSYYAAQFAVTERNKKRRTARQAALAEKRKTEKVNGEDDKRI
jgi:hypothetical protein